ncbi:MAG TPA: cation-transporting P-type ATPase, partial [Gemmatimonadales bacterium]|nr:cation-transporting P-type ATPase [Gemmatimonadales bacterium]
MPTVSPSPEPTARPASELAAAQVLAELATAPAGLSTAEAARRLAVTGPNVLPARGERPAARIVREQLANPLVLILLAALVVAQALGERLDALVILLIVVINLVLGFWQEFRAERALSTLSRLLDQRATLRRDGVTLDLPAREVVPGDIVELEIGDIVPADLRLLEVTGLECDESILTGEALPVLADGFTEGRRIFANTIKYVLMGTSSNFGNMFSAAGAFLFLSFLPMLPSQILLNN